MFWGYLHTCALDHRQEVVCWGQKCLGGSHGRFPVPARRETCHLSWLILAPKARWQQAAIRTHVESFYVVLLVCSAVSIHFVASCSEMSTWDCGSLRFRTFQTDFITWAVYLRPRHVRLIPVSFSDVLIRLQTILLTVAPVRAEDLIGRQVSVGKDLPLVGWEWLILTVSSPLCLHFSSIFLIGPLSCFLSFALWYV